MKGKKENQKRKLMQRGEKKHEYIIGEHLKSNVTIMTMIIRAH